VWDAKVKGACEIRNKNGSVERYVTLDHRSITEVPWDQLQKEDEAKKQADAIANAYTKEEPKKEAETTDNVVPFDVSKPDVFYRGFNNQQLTKEQWLDAVNCGCSWCTASLSLEDANKVVWIDAVSP